MIKDISNYTLEEKIALVLYGISGAMYEASSDMRKYLEYKELKKQIPNSKLILSEDDQVDVDILQLLEDNGFSFDELGTFLYKDVIKNVILTLKKIKNDDEKVELQHQLQNAYSQFYFDIARNDKDMGVKTFHAYIQNALSQIDYQDQSSCFIKNLCTQQKINYGQLAFVIGNQYLNKEEIKEQSQVIASYKPNILKLVNMSNSN